MATVADVMDIMNQMAPRRLAEDWDNVGLHFGSPMWPVKSIMVALEPSTGAVKAACEAGADMLITHHPLIFKPLKTIDVDSPTGEIIHLAARHQLAIFAAHTNLDSAKGGINDVFAERIGLSDLSVLCPAPSEDLFKPYETMAYDIYPLKPPSAAEGIGRIGKLAQPLKVADLAALVKERMGLKSVRYSGPRDLVLTTAAVCSGSGGGVLKDFMASKAQVLISGDLKYHDAVSALEQNRALIDAGHFASEHLIVPVLRERLELALQSRDDRVDVTGWGAEVDPFEYI